MYFLAKRIKIRIGLVTMLQIFILAAVAIFLFWRLRAVLGSRDGFEKTLNDIKDTRDVSNAPLVVDEKIENRQDEDIFDYVEENSKSADAFKTMKSLTKISALINLYQVQKWLTR